MPALPSSLIEPLWDQFAALIPPRVDTHPLGCHRPRIPDRVVFDKLVQVLVYGASYVKAGDCTCSATTIRTGATSGSAPASSSSSSSSAWTPTTRSWGWTCRT